MSLTSKFSQEDIVRMTPVSVPEWAVLTLDKAQQLPNKKDDKFNNLLLDFKVNTGRYTGKVIRKVSRTDQMWAVVPVLMALMPELDPKSLTDGVEVDWDALIGKQVDGYLKREGAYDTFDPAPVGTNTGK